MGSSGVNDMYEWLEVSRGKGKIFAFYPDGKVLEIPDKGERFYVDGVISRKHRDLIPRIKEMGISTDSCECGWGVFVVHKSTRISMQSKSWKGAGNMIRKALFKKHGDKYSFRCLEKALILIEYRRKKNLSESA